MNEWVQKLRRPKTYGTPIKWILARLGLAIFRYKPDFHYVPTLYGRSYKKKVIPRDDATFAQLADVVVRSKTSYLYDDRLHILYQAVRNIRQLEAQNISLAEVGVFRGGGSYFIASAANRLFVKPPRIHAIDTFEGHPDDMHESDTVHQPGGFSETSYEKVRDYLSVFPNVTVHKGRFEDRCGEMAGETFGFAHLDVDIYNPTCAALAFFAARMPVGGIIVVDDYGFLSCPGVKQAVDEFTASRRDFVAFQLDTGQCLLVRTAADS
jgi:hypothetical protein